MPNYYIYNQNDNKFFGKMVNTYASPGVIALPDNNATVNRRGFVATFTNSSSLGLL